MKKDSADFTKLDAMKNHPVSGQIDDIFKKVIKEETQVALIESPMDDLPFLPDSGQLSLDEAPEELDLHLNEENNTSFNEVSLDEGFELSLNQDEDLDLAEADIGESDSSGDTYGDLSLSVEDEVETSFEENSEAIIEDLGELSFSQFSDEPEKDVQIKEEPVPPLDLSAPISFQMEEDPGKSKEDSAIALNFEDELSLNFDIGEQVEFDAAELSDDAKQKLQEIDEIMDLDASNVKIKNSLQIDRNVDEPLVSDDMDLSSIDFTDDVILKKRGSKDESVNKKKRDAIDDRGTQEAKLGRDLKEISGAYSGEMERMLATISNLRIDREELLLKIEKLEEDKLFHSRQTLTSRAEIDERRIELTIIRKKLNDEINDLRDRLKVHDEKRLILEEKNRILLQELDKSAQKNKIDVKKVQMRERELEQRLELLKSDSETQIRHRDLKILELKRKIDAMEFDVESITQQEKRSVESRFELEDKLEKAIKTLRTAINVLEDETDRTDALNALKKNIDM